MLRDEVKKIISQLRDNGWRIEKGKHWRCIPPDKTKDIVFISLTPSDRRAIPRIKSDLRKSGINIK